MLNLFIIIFCLFAALILFFFIKRKDFFHSDNSFEEKYLYYIFLIIVFLGILLRIINLNYNSFWIDELFSINTAKMDSVSGILDDCRNDVHPPLYQLLLHYYIKFAGDSETAARLLSAVFGILSAAGFFLLANLLFNSKKAVAMMLMFTVAYFPVYYSQEVRSYSLLLLLTIITNYFFLKAFIFPDKSESGLKKFMIPVAFSLSGILLMLTHYYGITIFIFNFAFLFLYDIIKYSIRDTQKQLLVQIPVFLFTALIYYLLWGHNIFQQYQRMFWPKPLDKNFFSAFPFFIMNPNMKNYFISDFIITAFSILMAGFFTYYILVIIKCRIKKEKDVPENLNMLFLFLWILIPYAVSYLQTVYSNPSISFRNLIIVSPAVIMIFYLLTEKSINSVLNFCKEKISLMKKYFSGKNVFVNPFMLSLILSSLLFVKTYGYYAYPSKQDIRGLIKEVSENSELYYRNPLIFTTSKTASQLNYYFKRYSSDLRIRDYLAGENLQDELIKFKDEIDNRDYLVLIDLKNWGKDSESTISYFKSYYRLILSKESEGFAFYVFELKNNSN